MPDRPGVIHPPVESVRVLYRAGNETATLFRLVDGQNKYESLTGEQLLTLIETAAEALRGMSSRG